MKRKPMNSIQSLTPLTDFSRVHKGIANIATRIIIGSAQNLVEEKDETKCMLFNKLQAKGTQSTKQGIRTDIKQDCFTTAYSAQLYVPLFYI